MKRMVLTPVALAVSGLLLGCQSESDGHTVASAPQSSLEYTVVDGYLNDAFVFLDLNENGVFDEDSEPYGISGIDGLVSLDVSDVRNPSQYPAYAHAIAGVTKDQDLGNSGGFVTEDTEFSSPAGERIISPFTSLVHRKMRDDQVSLEEAQRSISTELNLQQEILMGDFFASTDDADRRQRNRQARKLAKSIVKTQVLVAQDNQTAPVLSDVLQQVKTFQSDLESLPDNAYLSLDDNNQVIVVNGDDTDSDGFLDSDDAFPNDPTEWRDYDGDNIGDNQDSDDDGDGVLDVNDPFPLNSERGEENVPNTHPTFRDNDGDGYRNNLDAFPNNKKEWQDTDGDGIGNNRDTDDDGDGYSDTIEVEHGTDPLDANSVPDLGADRDGDGVSDNKEIEQGTNPDVYNVPLSEGLKLALETGDVSTVATEDEVIDAAIGYIRSYIDNNNAIKQKLFGLDANGTNGIGTLTWKVSHDAAIFAPNFGRSDTVLVANAVSNPNKKIEPHVLGIVGQAGSQGTSFMALAANPMATYAKGHELLNDAMHQFLKNSVTWLANRDDFSDKSLNVVMAQLDDSYYFRHQSATRAWFEEFFPQQVQVNVPQACNGSALSTCITADTDLLVISNWMPEYEQNEINSIVASVESAIEQGIPVLYMHRDGGMDPLSNELIALFGLSYVGDNYWRKAQIADWNPTSFYDAAPADIAEQVKLLERIKSNSFNVDLSQCADAKCPDESRLKTEFTDPATTIYKTLKTRDEAGKTPLFDSENEEYLKLLVLLGDKLRQSIAFPMDKLTTPTEQFFRSYYADHSQYHQRPVNPAQSDMGNFSRSDFSHVTPTETTVNLVSKIAFRAAGVYALPGQTLTITRKDSNAVGTKVQINTQRSGSTQEFDQNGYKRPKYLKSRTYDLQSGETLSLTHPYGGPVQVIFDGNDQAVELDFSGIGLHPVWRSSADNSGFLEALAQHDFDWAELISPQFELHSTHEKMLKTLAREGWENPQDVAEAAQTYTFGHVYALAGYQGPSIPNLPQVESYAVQRGWTLATWDRNHHFNADMATCGAGCSGNPYDANWAFDPLGHGDMHEIGHTLERSRFRFEGWDSHASTNFYSYYSKSQYFKETGLSSACQKINFSDSYALIQASQTQANPVLYMKDNYDVANWKGGARFYIQLAAAAQKAGILDDGWHVIGRLHVYEREFSLAIKSDEAWQSAKQKLGYSNYTRDQAKSIAKDEWASIAISQVLERNMISYLNMWGIELDTQATTQISSYGYSSMAAIYIAIPEAKHCDSLNYSALVIDGSSSWPAE